MTRAAIASTIVGGGVLLVSLVWLLARIVAAYLQAAPPSTSVSNQWMADQLRNRRGVWRDEE